MKAKFFDYERREAAIRAERDADGRIPLAQLWQELTSGRARVVDNFITEDRCYLLLGTPLPGEKRSVLSDRRRTILEGLFCGQSVKALAFDLALSQSTVSQESRTALHQLGMDCTQSRVNPLLAMLSRAAADRQPTRCARIAYFSDTHGMSRVVGAARPDVRLAPILSPAEFAVVRGLFEGRNYLEIATNRGTSTRTVANQLAAAFRRLGVSGRGSLLSHIVSSADSLA